MKNLHLTEAQKEIIRGIANKETMRDLLLLVAGIVAHDTDDYATAIDASAFIKKAAVMVSIK